MRFKMIVVLNSFGGVHAAQINEQFLKQHRDEQIRVASRVYIIHKILINNTKGEWIILFNPRDFHSLCILLGENISYKVIRASQKRKFFISN